MPHLFIWAFTHFFSLFSLLHIFAKSCTFWILLKRFAHLLHNLCSFCENLNMYTILHTFYALFHIFAHFSILCILLVWTFFVNLPQNFICSRFHLNEDYCAENFLIFLWNGTKALYFLLQNLNLVFFRLPNERCGKKGVMLFFQSVFTVYRRCLLKIFRGF